MEALVNLRFEQSGVNDLAGNAWKNNYNVTFDEDGRFGGKAAKFNGSNSSLICMQGINMGVQEFTISFHAKPDPLNYGWGGMLGNYGSGNYIIVYALGNTAQDGVSLNFITSGNIMSRVPICDGAWHHIALTRIKGQQDVISLYVDGSLATQYNISTAQGLCFSPNVLILGAAYSPYKGLLDDICIIKNKVLWTGNFTPPTAYLLDVAKKLYLKNNEVWGMDSGIFKKLSDNYSALTDTEKEVLFSNSLPSITDLTTLGKFKMIVYKKTNNQLKGMIIAVPMQQLSLPKGLINGESFEGIDKVESIANISANASCKIIVTTDLVTYQAYDTVNQVWQTVDHADLSNVANSGIDATTLQNIPRAAWDILMNGKAGIGFAYLLSIEDSTDNCNIDKLDLTVDMKGVWNKAVYGTDYTYGYCVGKMQNVNCKVRGLKY